MSINYGECLRRLCPTAEFTIRGTEIEWLSSEITMPTEEEIQSIQTTINNEIPMKKLREYRNIVLELTDKYSLPDYPHGTEEIRNEWLTFRTNLRNITSQVPSLDENGKIINIIWTPYPENGNYP